MPAEEFKFDSIDYKVAVAKWNGPDPDSAAASGRAPDEILIVNIHDDLEGNVEETSREVVTDPEEIRAIIAGG